MLAGVESTKRVDIGGGWAATVRRPPFHVDAEWDLIESRANGKAPRDVQIVEHGHEPEPKRKDKKRREINPELHAFFEGRLLPACVITYHSPAGDLGPDRVYPPDLGWARFIELVRSISEFNAEANATFRGGTGSSTAGTGAEPAAVGEGDRPPAAGTDG